KFIHGLILDPIDSEAHNWKLARKYEVIAENETLSEEHRVDDAELVIVAYGTSARIAKGAIKRLRSHGMKIGLFRPITLWPFPELKLRALSAKIKNFLVFEMSTGQMLEDVRLALQGYANIEFHGRPGGAVPTPSELANFVARVYNKKDL
ncbi:MAG: 3-methyl-2-oxobutanoate dehydrogenase subunit beta, partial [Smithellaceae bacterium]|nr:3-methyl-2-oxobutanoate dehydrogenase subunit beta [Smithellaceae bacterium]